LTNSYLDLARTYGIPVKENGIWASVNSPNQEFGWKIHLSSTQSEAKELLLTVIPLLMENNVPFKFAKNDEILGEINEGTFGHTQVGKFITIYPSTPESSLDIAKKTVSLTKQFAGPTIVTDLHIGNIVYTRFGSYNPRFQRDRLGNNSMDDPDNQAKYTIPFTPPENQPNPFTSYYKGKILTDNKAKPIGPGYLRTKHLSSHAKGSVFLGMDVRSQDSIGAVILKEGRRYCMSDNHGRHMWDRLQHQYDIAQTIADDTNIAQVRDLFKHDNSLFLVTDYIDGVDFSERPAKAFGLKEYTEQKSLITEFINLTTSLKSLHKHGIINRYLSPRNVRIAADGSVYLLDLEMSHRINDDEHPPFMQGTSGFISPQQMKGCKSDFSDDIYSLGCLLVNALTGFDPRRLSLNDDESLADRLENLTQAPRSLIDLCVDSLKTEAKYRPSLEESSERLTKVRDELVDYKNNEPSSKVKVDETKIILEKSLDWLIDGGIRDPSTNLPLSPEIESTDHDSSLSMPQAYKLYRSTNRGVSGVVYTIARLHKLGIKKEKTNLFIENAVDWLLGHHPTPDDQMPGLHFGEAGVAMAIAESVRAGLIDAGQWLQPYLKEALCGPIDWPDLTHGAAGQGIAALHCSSILNMPELADHAHKCADYLLDNQLEDGSWSWPNGVGGMEDTIYSGFAHGVSGIVYFLSGYHLYSGSDKALIAAQNGANWIIKQAQPTKDRKSFWWPMKANDDQQAWHWWCHGGTGISLALLAIYEINGDQKYADMVRKSLRIHPVNIRYPNLSQCHGLSGLGEIYLEAHRVLGDDEWKTRADEIGKILLAMRIEKDDKISWLVENPYHPTADLMIGCGGVAHFLARLALPNGDKLGMPLSFDPGDLQPFSKLS
jgi:serine/threonine protein kinase